MSTTPGTTDNPASACSGGLARPGTAFVRESNRIERITREPTTAELDEFERFMRLRVVTVEEMERFVSVYQPDAVLRDRRGLDVRVGAHVPPRGGPDIRDRLATLLRGAHRVPDLRQRQSLSYLTHCRYETLHPFTDGNGRSGRMLWAWQMQAFPLGFLHHFYYQALDGSQAR